MIGRKDSAFLLIMCNLLALFCYTAQIIAIFVRCKVQNMLFEPLIAYSLSLISSTT